MADCKKKDAEEETVAFRNGEYIRQEVMFLEVSKLKKEGILKAMKKWGQPKSKITHLVFSTHTLPVMPDTDKHLTKLLGFGYSVQYLSYEQGCFDHNTVLRIFTDFANNNHHTHVLLVCVVITVGGSCKEPQPRVTTNCPPETSTKEPIAACSPQRGIGKIEIQNLHVHIRGDVHIHVRPEEAEAWYHREGTKIDEKEHSS